MTSHAAAPFTITEYKQRTPRAFPHPSYDEPSLLVGGQRRAVAYLRKSRVIGEDYLSDVVQTDSVVGLASKYDETIGEADFFIDWNRSGSGSKTHRRKAYLELKRLVAGDQVSTVYVYSLSRLARSTYETLAFMELCIAHGTKVRAYETSALANMSADDAMAKVFRTIMAAINELQLDMMTKVNQDVAKIRRAKGQVMGSVNYGWMVVDKTKIVRNPAEPLEHIIETYRQVGTVAGAARELNRQKVPTRRGAPWSTRSVALILEREAPELLPARRTRGIKPQSAMLLFRLLRCHCGTLLTAHRDRGSQVRYRCNDATVAPGHGRSSVAESKLIDWVKRTAASYAPPGDTLARSEDNASQVKALKEEMRKVAHTYLRGGISEAEHDALLADHQATIDGLEAENRTNLMVDVAIDWDDPEVWDTVLINRYLRGLWEYVQLDAELVPVAPKWRVPHAG